MTPTRSRIHLLHSGSRVRTFTGLHRAPLAISLPVRDIHGPRANVVPETLTRMPGRFWIDTSDPSRGDQCSSRAMRGIVPSLAPLTFAVDTVISVNGIFD